MATTVVIETSKTLPPKGSPPYNRLVLEIQTAVGTALGDAMIKVEIKKKSKR